MVEQSKYMPGGMLDPDWYVILFKPAIFELGSHAY